MTWHNGYLYTRFITRPSFGFHVLGDLLMWHTIFNSPSTGESGASSYDFVPLLSKNSEKPVRRDRDRVFQNWDQTSNKRKDTSLECQKHQQFSSIHTSFNFPLETLESVRGVPFCVTFKHKENCTLTKLLTWAELHCFQGFESYLGGWSHLASLDTVCKRRFSRLLLWLFEAFKPQKVTTMQLKSLLSLVYNLQEISMLTNLSC